MLRHEYGMTAHGCLLPVILGVPRGKALRNERKRMRQYLIAPLLVEIGTITCIEPESAAERRRLKASEDFFEITF